MYSSNLIANMLFFLFKDRRISIQWQKSCFFFKTNQNNNSNYPETSLIQLKSTFTWNAFQSTSKPSRQRKECRTDNHRLSTPNRPSETQKPRALEAEEDLCRIPAEYSGHNTQNRGQIAIWWWRRWRDEAQKQAQGQVVIGSAIGPYPWVAFVSIIIVLGILM